MKRLGTVVYLVLSIWLPLLILHCSKGDGTGPNNKLPTAYLDAPTKVFLNRPIHLKANATDNDGRITEYQWKIGASSWIIASKKDTIIRSPSTPQQLLCSLRVIDNGGSFGYDSKVIYVESAPPVAKIANQYLIVGAYEPIQLYASATDEVDTGTIVDFEWKIGYSMWKSVKKMVIDTMTKDTLLISDTTFQAPSTPQTLICSLRVTDNDGIFAYSRVNVQVINKPTSVSVETDKRISLINMPVKLLGNAVTAGTDSIVRWEWKIGLKPWNTSRKDTIIKPEEAGALVCSLRVTNSYGLFSYSSVTLLVKPSDLTAVSTASPLVVFVNGTVQLGANASSSSNEPISRWEWKIGTKPWTITGKDTLIRPEEPGELLCSLRVTNMYGSIALSAVKVIVKVTDLTAVATADPIMTIINNQVKLSGKTFSSNGNEAVVEWAWKIGNKPWIVASKDTTIRPEEPGELLCSLRVTNSFGVISRSFVKVIVRKSDLTAKAEADPRDVYVNSQITLKGDVSSSSEESVIEWAWKIGTKPWTVSKKDTIIKPEQVGTLQCSLRVITNLGSMTTTGVQVFVRQPPVQAVASALQQVVYINNPIQLKGDASIMSDDAIIEWAWKIGNKPWQLSSKDTTITAEEVSNLICSLRVTDKYGVVAKSAVTITINPANIQAIAGNTIQTGLNDPVRLSGKGVPAEQIVMYRWKIGPYPWKTTNKDTTIISASSAQLWLCSLEVVDKYGQSDKDAFELHAESKPPIAIASASQIIVTQNGTVTLKGTGFDNEGIRSYAWKIGEYPWREFIKSSIKDTIKDTVIQVPSMIGSQLVCSLRVVDVDFEEAKTSITLTVNSGNVFAYAGQDTVVNINQNVKLHGQELSGAKVLEWWWRIDLPGATGSGIWRRTSGPDTTFFTPSYIATVVCSLRVKTENQLEGYDEIRINIQNIADNKIVYTLSNGIGVYINSLRLDNERIIYYGTCEDPEWSHNGNLIAFVASSNIVIVDVANNYTARTLTSTSDCSNPSWLNDQTILYERSNTTNHEVWRVDITGGFNARYVALPTGYIEEPFANPANANEMTYLSSNSSGSTGADRDNIYLYSTSTGTRKIKGNGNTNNSRQTRSNLVMRADRFLWNAQIGTSNTTRYLYSLASGDTANVFTIKQINTNTSSSNSIRGIFGRDGSTIYYAVIGNSSNNYTMFYRNNLTGTAEQWLDPTNNTLNGRIVDFDIK